MQDTRIRIADSTEPVTIEESILGKEDWETIAEALNWFILSRADNVNDQNILASLEGNVNEIVEMFDQPKETIVITDDPRYKTNDDLYKDRKMGYE